MAFQNCEQIHDTFRDGQQLWHSASIKERFSPNYAWYGRMQSKSFPTGHGSEQRGFRLGAMAAPSNLNWRKLNFDLCDNNACSFAPEEIKLPGSDDYTYCILRSEAVTPWLCLDGLIGKHNAVEEIEHIEEQLQRINRFYMEQFTRTNYIDQCDHHWVGLLPPSGEGDYCVNAACFKSIVSCGGGALNDQMWMFERWEDGTLNEGRIRVAVPYTELYRIAPPSLDMFRTMLQQIDQRDKAVNLYDRDKVESSSEDPMMDYNRDVFEIVLPDIKLRPLLEKELSTQAQVPGAFVVDTLDHVDPRLGGKFRMEDFVFRYDDDMMRYAPVPPTQQPPPGMFDASNPATWAVLEIVPKYVEAPAARGSKNLPNSDWQFAPFAIAANFIRAVGCLEMLGDYSGTGSARKRDDYLPEAEIVWKSPDWPCNIKGNYGFWMFQHNMAFHPRRTEFGHAWLIRLDHRIHLTEIMCDMMVKRCSPYYSHFECDRLHCFKTDGTILDGAMAGPTTTTAIEGTNKLV